eukprot:707817-Ditylum_brightwellii.AAC.2
MVSGGAWQMRSAMAPPAWRAWVDTSAEWIPRKGPTLVQYFLRMAVMEVTLMECHVPLEE